MLRELRTNRIAVKYLIITVVVLGVIVLLTLANKFDGISETAKTAMNTLASYGEPGMLVLALLSNMTLVIIVPYNLPMLTLVIYANSLWKVALIGAATGLGGGIGETASYGLARTLTSQIHHLSDSALFRWMKDNIDRHPRLIPLFVFLVSGTPVPDMTMIVPLSLIRYPWSKMIVPMITGKIVQNVVVALIFRFAADAIANFMSSDISLNLATALIALFIILIAYQIEAARANKKKAELIRSRSAAVEAEQISAAD